MLQTYDSLSSLIRSVVASIPKLPKQIAKLIGVCTALFLIIAIPTKVSAQDAAWRVVRSAGDTLPNSSLNVIDDTVLAVTFDDRLLSVSIDSVELLLHHKDSHFLRGAGYGTLIGGAAGAVIGAVSYHEPEHHPGEWFYIDFGRGAVTGAGAILGAVGGFVIGGIIGATSGGSETFLFT